MEFEINDNFIWPSTSSKFLLFLYGIIKRSFHANKLEGMGYMKKKKTETLLLILISLELFYFIGMCTMNRKKSI
jgi:hypothetical protein